MIYRLFGCLEIRLPQLSRSNKSVFSFLRQLKIGTARICCCGPCCAVLLRRPPCSNRSISPGPTAANAPPAAAADEWDRQTDRRTYTVTCFVYCAGSGKRNAYTNEVFVGITLLNFSQAAFPLCAFCAFRNGKKL